MNKKPSLLKFFCCFFLKPPLIVFRFLIFSRNILFNHSFFVTKVSCRIISVGNITVGGTGKTPYVIDCVKKLKQQGLKVAVLMRGYKGKRSLSQMCVSSGKKILMSPEEAGEEAFLIALSLPDVPVYVHPRRSQIASLAIQKDNVDVCVLDDGFQHRFLWRNEDIVLWNAWENIDHQSFFPLGRLREPLSSLKRASQIVVTKANHMQKEKILTLVTKLKKYCPSVRVMQDKPLYWMKYPEKDKVLLSDLKGKSALLFCALGHPESFVSLVKELDVQVKKTYCFRDHHVFTQKDEEFLYKEKEKNHSDYLICTMKDWVKIKSNLSCYVLICTLEELFL